MWLYIFRLFQSAYLFSVFSNPPIYFPSINFPLFLCRLFVYIPFIHSQRFDFLFIFLFIGLYLYDGISRESVPGSKDWITALMAGVLVARRLCCAEGVLKQGILSSAGQTVDVCPCVQVPAVTVLLEILRCRNCENVIRRAAALFTMALITPCAIVLLHYSQWRLSHHVQ